MNTKTILYILAALYLYKERAKIRRALGMGDGADITPEAVAENAARGVEEFAYWGPKEKNVWDQGRGAKAWKGGQRSDAAPEIAPASPYADIAKDVNSWMSQWGSVPGVGENLAKAQAELAKLGIKG